MFYVTAVARDFFHYVDKTIYLAVDDSEATVSYSLATEGRYGFLSSPLLVGTVRTHGPVNYGPWYFYLSAALIWFFGYSLTLARSIHLAIIIGTVAAAAFLFRSRDRVAATALFGFGIVYCFDAAQWPMVRPDSLVSACAVALVACVALGSTRWRAGWWFGAGLAAACGALTHLIAWTLLPSAGVLFLVAAIDRLRSREAGTDARRDVIVGAVAFAAGVATIVTSFYASFGFRIQEQLAFLGQYRTITASTSSYSTVLLTHLGVAFTYLPDSVQFMLGGALVCAWAWFGYTVFRPTASRTAVHAYLFPPALIWSAYIVSIGWYPNYHQGYVILHHVLAWWTVAALLFVTLGQLRLRFPRAGEGMAMFALILLVVQGGREVNWRIIDRSDKVKRADSWVSVSDYVGRVLDQIPARSAVWGSLIFGIEVPSRIQLVQTSDAFSLAAKVPWPERQALVPDYLVFGYPENRDDVLSAFHRDGDSMRAHTAGLLPRESFRLVSLVAAPPYGATRIYERTTDAAPGIPSVSVYDAGHHNWQTRLGPQAQAVFAAVAPMPLQIGYGTNPPPGVMPRNAVAADLSAGPYLLRVDIQPGAGIGRRKRLIAATPANMLRQAIGELGPAGDFSAYLAADRTLFLLVNHPGGRIVVSQFDEGDGAAIAAIAAMPIVGLLDPSAEVSHVRSLPNLSAWTPTAGVTTQDGAQGSVRLAGNDTSFGYQIASPVVLTAPLDKVTVKMKMTIEAGRVCTGFLNATSETWLVPPDKVRDEVTFSADDSGGFRMVFANCNVRAQGVRSQFVLEPGSYLVESTKLYVDRFVDAAMNATKVQAFDIDSAPLDPDVHLVPPTLRIGRRDLARPVVELQPADLSYKAAVVERTANGWNVKGTADGPFTYLMRSKERKFDAGTRLVVSGRVERGGITIGLFKKDNWVRQLNIETAGPFTVVIAPPSSGSYSLTIANDLPGGLDTSISFSKMGFLSVGQ